MKLIYANPSPYARKVRLTILEKGLTGIEPIAVNPFDLPPALIAANPLSKVPALILVDGNVLYDSPVICEYLDTLAESPRLLPQEGAQRWQVLRRQALCDGILDATFNISCEINRRPENERSPDWIGRWCEAIRRSLVVLEGEIGDFGEAMTLAHIAAGCALSYLDLRVSTLIDWRIAHPHLAVWYRKFELRPSMMATRPQ